MVERNLPAIRLSARERRFQRIVYPAMAPWGLADLSLASVPRGDLGRFFLREGREHQFGIIRVPCERFGFVDRQTQHIVLRLDGVMKFIQNRLFNVRDPVEQLAA